MVLFLSTILVVIVIIGIGIWVVASDDTRLARSSSVASGAKPAPEPQASVEPRPAVTQGASANVIDAQSVRGWGSDRPLDPIPDAEGLFANPDIVDLASAVGTYFNFLIDHSDHHEDFERDACAPLIEMDGPYQDLLAAAYEYSEGEPMPDDYGPTFDDLRYYLLTQDEASILMFLARYLGAMRGETGAGLADEPDRKSLKAEFIATTVHLLE